MTEWTNEEICYECTGYGDDYFVNEYGELECRCDSCYIMSEKRRYDNDDSWWD